MSRYNDDQKEKEKFSNCRLHYVVKDAEYCAQSNRENYEIIKEALDEMGIIFDLEGNDLRISILPDFYLRRKKRRAGPKKNLVQKEEKTKNGWNEYYKYSDVVYLIETRKDNRLVAKELGMKSATYYRHKRTMLESDYYQSLDKDRLTDRDYLESVKGNRFF
jgi:hypothetical protein